MELSKQPGFLGDLFQSLPHPGGFECAGPAARTAEGERRGHGLVSGWEGLGTGTGAATARLPAAPLPTAGTGLRPGSLPQPAPALRQLCPWQIS